ncbi:hypothetical protein INT44_007519 [Umbelopsis vinacea]|uniref:Uncharacterized protein n=1 Tax=Umbelopsis vinacea TaxID=44442 RepID=A0A8H7UBJ3_9FUNG|nr:hypothetical protein INT44_007519 [Umbelopsis vinacea]
MRLLPLVPWPGFKSRLGTPHDQDKAIIGDHRPMPMRSMDKHRRHNIDRLGQNDRVYSENPYEHSLLVGRPYVLGGLGPVCSPIGGLSFGTGSASLSLARSHGRDSIYYQREMNPF